VAGVNTFNWGCQRFGEMTWYSIHSQYNILDKLKVVQCLRNFMSGRRVAEMTRIYGEMQLRDKVP
jgi:hypothetical protein